MKVISLGLGLQSTAMYLMSSTGFIERADCAIFADPGAESVETYKYLDWLLKWAEENNGIPIYVDRSKNILSDLLNSTNSTGQRFASIPLFTIGNDGKVGMLRRQCTFEYKINIVNKVIRKIYGLRPRQLYPITEVWTGITVDEADRMKPSQFTWCLKTYPLIDLNYDRHECIVWLLSNGYPVPPKSSCVFCPFQSQDRWRRAKETQSSDWTTAVSVDRAVRNSTKKGIKQPAFLHRSCKPIEEVNFGHEQYDLFANECEGGCGL